MKQQLSCYRLLLCICTDISQTECCGGVILGVQSFNISQGKYLFSEVTGRLSEGGSGNQMRLRVLDLLKAKVWICGSGSR